jgi:hypothetical protein
LARRNVKQEKLKKEAKRTQKASKSALKVHDLSQKMRKNPQKTQENGTLLQTRAG